MHHDQQDYRSSSQSHCLEQVRWLYARDEQDYEADQRKVKGCRNAAHKNQNYAHSDRGDNFQQEALVGVYLHYFQGPGKIEHNGYLGEFRRLELQTSDG